MMPTASPRRICMLAPRRMSLLPKDLCTPCSSSSTSPVLAAAAVCSHCFEIYKSVRQRSMGFLSTISNRSPKSLQQFESLILQEFRDFCCIGNISCKSRPKVEHLGTQQALRSIRLVLRA